ncbi:hypothetical protein F3Y22_tig00110229pilonHSYRG00018 [Hibiscus syriacus]|uniref:Uncharacterized protein n=1 Tax=Hibiscus syriacus TaxID=106335 RepID=A0A6A3B6Y6_HIBSY|nr:hypothetical protein F3Y22_tig00110229pilonHSYRG00018 [Hibiscus syriacus]
MEMIREYSRGAMTTISDAVCEFHQCFGYFSGKSNAGIFEEPELLVLSQPFHLKCRLYRMVHLLSSHLAICYSKILPRKMEAPTFKSSDRDEEDKNGSLKTHVPPLATTSLQRLQFPSAASYLGFIIRVRSDLQGKGRF